MTKFIRTVEKVFGTTNLYEVLGLTSQEATTAQVKKAYYRLSLKVHPDRVNDADKQSSTEKFQALSYIYTILSDPDKRNVYDESGEVDGELDSAQDKDWEAYWRLLYQKISVEDIKQFEMKYKNSEAELEDLKEAYLENKGDMDVIMETVLCAGNEDEERFTNILKDLIKKKEIHPFSKFTREPKAKKQSRKKRAEADSKEAEECAKELGLDGSEETLRNVITKRNVEKAAEFDSLITSLEEKYAGKKTKSTDPPSEPKRRRVAKKREVVVSNEPSDSGNSDPPKVKRGRKPKSVTETVPQEESVPKPRKMKNLKIIPEEKQSSEKTKIDAETTDGNVKSKKAPEEPPPVAKPKRGRKQKTPEVGKEETGSEIDFQSNGHTVKEKPKPKLARKKKAAAVVEQSVSDGEESPLDPEPAPKPKKGRKKTAAASESTAAEDPPLEGAAPVKPRKGRPPKPTQTEEQETESKPQKTKQPRGKKATDVEITVENEEKPPKRTTTTKRKTKPQ